MYRGVRLHLDTDQVLKGDPLIWSNHAEFVPKYNQVISPTAARMFADIGLELLLDGFMLDEPGILDSFKSSLKALKDPLLPIAKFAKDPEKVERFLSNWSGNSDPYIYQDPTKVAKIIHRRFHINNRPRFYFEESKIPELAEILTEQQTAVGLIAGQIMDLTVAKLSLVS